MIRPTLEWRDPQKLMNHPLSLKVYGDLVNHEFVERIKQDGEIYDPIHILSDNTVLSGHERKTAARINGFPKVPVLVIRHLKDPNEIERYIIRSNDQREKTVEQRTREGVEIERIEKALGEARKRQNLKKGREIPEGPKIGRSGEHPSRTAAAEHAKMSHETYRQAKEVVAQIDLLETEGKIDEANELRAQLEQNVSGTHREIAEPESPLPTDRCNHPLPKHLEPVFETGAKIRNLKNRLSTILGEADRLGPEPGGELLHLPQFRMEIRNCQHVLIAAEPHAVCPFCKGRSCKQCKNLGWINVDHWNGIVPEQRGE